MINIDKHLENWNNILIRENMKGFEMIDIAKIKNEIYIHMLNNDAACISRLEVGHVKIKEYINYILEKSPNNVKYVPYNMVDREFYNDMFQRAVAACPECIRYVDLKFVLKCPNKYADICINAVMRNGDVLRHIYVMMLPDDILYDIILEAVKNKPEILIHVSKIYAEYCQHVWNHLVDDGCVKLICDKPDCECESHHYGARLNMTYNEYLNLCRVSVSNNGLCLYMVFPLGIERVDYINICYTALKNNAYCLQYISYGSIKIYGQLCSLAAIHNGYSIKYIDDKFINDNPIRYVKICMSAICENPMAIKFAKLQTQKMRDMAYAGNKKSARFFN